jgi:hypothetical protein
LRDGVVQIAYKMLCKKLGKIIKRARKIGQVVNQTPTLGPKHDKIQA